VPGEHWNDASALEAEGQPRLYFQRVPEPKAGKNRVHVDLVAGSALGDRDGMSIVHPGNPNALGITIGCIRIGRRVKVCQECGWLYCRSSSGARSDVCGLGRAQVAMR
jgi:hypothetical protein